MKFLGCMSGLVMFVTLLIPSFETSLKPVHHSSFFPLLRITFYDIVWIPYQLENRQTAKQLRFWKFVISFSIFNFSSNNKFCIDVTF
jgi:hypothetical protein